MLVRAPGFTVVCGIVRVLEQNHAVRPRRLFVWKMHMVDLRATLATTLLSESVEMGAPNLQAPVSP